MSTLFIYMVKTAAYLTVFYLVYSIMLSRDTSYGRNRAFILISLAMALIFPFFTIQTIKPMGIQFFGKFLAGVLITASKVGKGNAFSGSVNLGFIQVLYSVYIAGVSIFLFKLVLDFLNLFFLIVRQKNKGSRIIKFHGFNTSGFSAMGYIFINTRLSPEESCEIIKHEQNHLKQNHFLDIIFIEIVMAFQWFNPVVYMFNRSLRAIHEFQADRECLISGIPVVNYQSLLLSQVFKTRIFKLTNSFSNPSLVKKRMIMMTKKPTSSLANMKLLIVIPATAIVFLAISAYREIPVSPVKQIISSSAIKTSALSDLSKSSLVQGSNEIFAPPPPPPPPPQNSNIISSEEKKDEKITDQTEEVPFVVVEEMPMYPGGDTELLRYIAESTSYPERAKNNNIEGRVIVRFCVTAKGGISQVSVIKGVDPDLDAEAIRVVNTLPPFNPGKQGGKEVPVWYMVPITFTLR